MNITRAPDLQPFIHPVMIIGGPAILDPEPILGMVAESQS